MSGGEMVVAPAALVIAPIALVAVGAGIAAALAVRAAAAGTEAAGRALEQFGDEMARKADRQDELAVRGRLWDLAAGSAAATNMELRLLAARAEQAGVRVMLPKTIDLTGYELTATPKLVAEVTKALSGARHQVEQAEAVRLRQSLLAKLPATGESPTAAELLARHQEVLDRRLERTTAVAPPKAPRRADPSQVRAEIDAVLLRLDVAATPADREEVLEAASRAALQKAVGASRTYLDALGRKVDKEVNPRIARRREAAAMLDALEHPMVAKMINDVTPRPPCLGSVKRLRAVVHGEEDLTDELRSDGRSAIAWVQVELDRRRLLDGVAEAFAGLGYSVTTGMGVKLSVAKNTWRGFTADVWVDEAGKVQSHLVQASPEAAGEADRCSELNQDMGQVGARMRRAGRPAEVVMPRRLKRAIRRFRPEAAGRRSSGTETTLRSKQIDNQER
jgi:hypothetical protein